MRHCKTVTLKFHDRVKWPTIKVWYDTEKEFAEKITQLMKEQGAYGFSTQSVI